MVRRFLGTTFILGIFVFLFTAAGCEKKPREVQNPTLGDKDASKVSRLKPAMPVGGGGGGEAGEKKDAKKKDSDREPKTGKE
jgi:hypothetical protein